MNKYKEGPWDVIQEKTTKSFERFKTDAHNERARSDLKKLLAGLGPRPIILVEQDGLGKTIIEKFEHYARACSFAFVLMTPDDTAGMTSEGESRWLARPNVIMELGWFMAHLGRDRVAIPYTGKLEIPSDIHGLEYIEFKESVKEVADRICQTLSGA